MPSSIPQFPHCDRQILHAPSECTFCDQHNDWQQLREVWGINFTGKSDPDKRPCPSELRRPVDQINLWPGNRPTIVESDPQGPSRYERLLAEYDDDSMPVEYDDENS